MSLVTDNRALKSTIRKRAVDMGLTDKDLGEIAGSDYKRVRAWLNSYDPNTNKITERQIQRICDKIGIEYKLVIVIKPLDELECI